MFIPSISTRRLDVDARSTRDPAIFAEADTRSAFATVNASNANGPGVNGSSANGSGVFASSRNGTGLQAQSTFGTGYLHFRVTETASLRWETWVSTGRA
jgi:hypothetical protein